MIITPKIQIIRKEVDDTHYYFIDGKFYPSVTKILEEAAPTPWALKQFFLRNTPESAEEIKNTAGDFGSKMHDIYARMLLGEEFSLVDQNIKYKKHITSFAQWFADWQPKEIQTEQTVASLVYKYAGTLDLLCKKDNEIWLIDFKTSAGIYYNYELQVAAYKQAVEETFGLKIDHVAILRTGSQHKCGYEFKEVTRPIESFMNVYQTYVDMNDGKIPEPPITSIYPDTIKLEVEQ